MASLGPPLQNFNIVEGCVPHNSAHSSSSGSLANLSDTTTVGFLVAVHRKMVNERIQKDRHMFNAEEDGLLVFLVSFRYVKKRIFCRR